MTEKDKLYKIWGKNHIKRHTQQEELPKINFYRGETCLINLFIYFLYIL